LKAAKWISLGITILSGIECLLLHWAPVIIGRFLVGEAKDASAIGIIGGSDGPTAIFVSNQSVIRPIAPIVFALFLLCFCFVFVILVIFHV